MLDVASVMREVGHRLGAGALDLPVGGQSLLLLDGEHHLLLDHRPEIGAVYLRLLMRIPPKADHELGALYRALLEANGPGGRNAGAVLAIDAAQELLELQARLPMRTVSPERVIARIETMRGAAEALAAEFGLFFDVEDEPPADLGDDESEPEGTEV